MSTLFRSLFFWLSGAGSGELKQCPTWEQRKYCAYGATVLVPSLFALIACGYALSTLTEDWRIIVPISLAWAFIILSIDRALLASYRAFLPFTKRVSQFILRFVVAGLMGMTIAHPLTLLIFKDTITSEIEKERQTEIDQVRQEVASEKEVVSKKITALEAEVVKQRTEWDETFNAKFLVETLLPGEKETAMESLPEEVKTQIAEVRQPFEEKAEAYEREFGEENEKFKKLQGELDYWQREFEREVNGQRSGLVGLGPRAKSIRDDQLEWRRNEAKRLAQHLEFLTAEINHFRTEARAAEAKVIAQYEAQLTEEQLKKKEEEERIVSLKRKMQAEQAEQFVDQQNVMRATMAKQIEAKLEELKGVQNELATLTAEGQKRIDELASEPRRDLLTQSLALHGLFKRGDDGGQFALMTYLVLIGLFLLVDTMPLLVKFFSQPGPYDTILDRDEFRFAQDRESFVRNYAGYREGLDQAQLSTITQDKPLEKALIDGVERSRATKEFLNALFEMEQAFEEKLQAERARLSEHSPEKLAMLEKMAESFYEDLRKRAERFFEGGTATQFLR